MCAPRFLSRVVLAGVVGASAAGCGVFAFQPVEGAFDRTLTVGGPSGASGITVVDVEGQVIGVWDANGIAITDPPHAGYAGNPNYKMTIDEAGLYIWDMSDANAPIPVVSITPAGIDAASIRFGSARGGHNLVQNSSFELGAFSATVVTPNKWDIAADWNATRVGSDVNITTNAGNLTMTTI